MRKLKYTVTTVFSWKERGHYTTDKIRQKTGAAVVMGH